MIKDIVSSLSIPQIFISKRFWTAAFGLVSMVLVGLIPQLAESAVLLQAGALALTSLLITSFTGQDWKVADAQGESKYQRRGVLIEGELLSTLGPVELNVPSQPIENG